MYPAGFKGKAIRLTDIDVARVGRIIGVGEDEIRAVLEVETTGGGFDAQGRPKMLFEPHVFYRELGEGPKRVKAEATGLAYRKWGSAPYLRDSYSRLQLAMNIDANSALRSASWGIGQVMGFNHKAAGFKTAGDMVAAFCESEAAGLEGMINFIVSEQLDDDLRRHDWSGFARGYNGAGYAAHGYHTKLAAAFVKWQAIPDALAPNYPKIGMGSRNAAVRTAQERLLAMGFDPKGCDGVFGAATRAATVAFQLANGLVGDGLIGPKTWAALIPEIQNG